MYSHCNSVATKSVQYISGSCEIQNGLGWSGMSHSFDLTVDKSRNGKVPSGVSGHAKTEKGPYPVVVKRWNKYCGCTTRSEYVSPRPLVQLVVYIIYVTVHYCLNTIKTHTYTKNKIKFYYNNT